MDIIHEKIPYSYPYIHGYIHIRVSMESPTPAAAGRNKAGYIMELHVLW